MVNDFKSVFLNHFLNENFHVIFFIILYTL
jgi:hypothetical protein